jgi:hypothetical protein
MGYNPATWASKQNLPHDLILNQETMGMKLNKGMIVKIKLMSIYKMFVGTRNMKHIL